MIQVKKLAETLTQEQITENKEDCYCNKCKNNNISDLLLVRVSKINSIDKENNTYEHSDLNRVYCVNCFPDELLPFLQDVQYSEDEARFKIIEKLLLLFNLGYSVDGATESALGEKISYIKKCAGG